MQDVIIITEMYDITRLSVATERFLALDNIIKHKHVLSSLVIEALTEMSILLF